MTNTTRPAGIAPVTPVRKTADALTRTRVRAVYAGERTAIVTGSWCYVVDSPSRRYA